MKTVSDSDVRENRPVCAIAGSDDVQLRFHRREGDA